MLVEHGARIEDNDIQGVRPVDLHPVSVICRPCRPIHRFTLVHL